MKIIKRNGKELEFDITKIIVAICKANIVVDKEDRLDKSQINQIAQDVEKNVLK